MSLAEAERQEPPHPGDPTFKKEETQGEERRGGAPLCHGAAGRGSGR